MAKQNAVKALREAALALPDTEAGIACEGTALEKTTVKTRKKAFLFLGMGDAMLKLDASLAEASKLAKKEPARWKVGNHGWVTTKFSADEPPPLDILTRWIAESYRAVGGATTKKAAKKKAKKK